MKTSELRPSASPTRPKRMKLECAGQRDSCSGHRSDWRWGEPVDVVLDQHDDQVCIGGPKTNWRSSVRAGGELCGGKLHITAPAFGQNDALVLRQRSEKSLVTGIGAYEPHSIEATCSEFLAG